MCICDVTTLDALLFNTSRKDDCVLMWLADLLLVINGMNLIYGVFKNYNMLFQANLVYQSILCLE